MSGSNIWLICKYASPKKYFFGTRHFSFATEWVKTGNDVTIITSNSSHMTNALPQFKEDSFEEFIEGVRTIWLNIPTSKSSNGLKRIISWFLFELHVLKLPKNNLPKPDTVIISSLSLLSVWSGLYFSWKYKAKFIFEVRDIWPLSGIKLGNISKWNPLMMFLGVSERIGYKYSDLIVGTMPNLVAHVKNTSPNYADKVITIPQVYDKEFYENEQEALPQTFIDKYLNGNNFIICYAGTVSSNNPLNQLLDAAQGLNCTVLIVGEGKEKNRLINQYSMTKNIIFAPSIEKAQVQHLLSMVDVCYDSIESDIGEFGLSRNKWIDYMMARKPIICAFNGYQSMINEAKSGYFVEYGNVPALKALITKVISDPQGVENLSKNAKRWIMENRSSEKMSKKYLQYINNVH